MRWRLIEASDDDDDALTADELIGISVRLAQATYGAGSLDSVPYRAWLKIQDAVEQAIGESPAPVNEDGTLGGYAE